MRWPIIRSWLTAATILSVLSSIFATQVAISISDSALSTKRQQIQQTQQPEPHNAADKQLAAGSSKSLPSGRKQRPQQVQSAKQGRHRNTSNQNQAANITKPTVRLEQEPTKPVTNQRQITDQSTLAQRQAKIMMDYNNTPPLFVTDTRDFFIDVARQPIGTIIKTIRAVDLDGDQLEYSLQPANLRDASPYFAINPNTGELKLANHSFEFYKSLLPTTQGRKKPTTEPSSTPDGDDDGEATSDEGATDEEEGSDGGNQTEDQRSLSKNMYFLNVAVDDGRYTSIVELQIHVINSSSLAIGPAEGTKRAPDEQLFELLRKKTEEFYNELHKAPSTHTAATTINNISSPIVVYPNFVNPGLVKPGADLDSEINHTSKPSRKQTAEEHATISHISSSTTSGPSPTQNSLTTTDADAQTDHTSSNSITPQGTLAELAHNRQQRMDEPLVPQLVTVCVCFLIICVVLFIFIVPLSIKQLRRRLKNVELQHEHLSQQTSNRSSTVCSTSSTTSSTRNHMPSLSQFTLSSARSSAAGALSVCRQSSLDSANFVMPPPLFGGVCGPLDRLNNGFIANPVYLQQQQQHHHPGHLELQHQITSIAHGGPQIIQNQAFILHGQINDGQPITPQKCDNLYYPIDDDDYSTINTGSTIENTSTGATDIISKQVPILSTDDYFFTRRMQPSDDRPIESRNSDSGSSTRSLARFLSLPARHSAHQSAKSKTTDELDECPVDQIFRQVTSKTIARTSKIEHDQQHTNRSDWELDRHKLKLLDILDAGQFGQVWRCNLKQSTGDITVAVKMLKNNATKDERGREELLAEIAIMKLVCNHPHVVKILHCCTSNDSLFVVQPILLVMEYVEMGKLQSYLENSRVNHNYATNQYNNNQATSDHLTSKDLVKFIYHVAKGMEYISSQWIVHRDLASRNILVSSQRICKIGDFGMARHMQSFGGIYERHSQKTKIPVRWMAPEVLLNNRFTTKSDVFSFGILMWEIVTLGSTPYRHLKTEQVIKEVARNGERPSKPEYCHDQLYRIMSKCWLHEPDERPTFRDLVNQLDVLLLSANDYIELDQYPDHNYYNIPETAAPHEKL